MNITHEERLEFLKAFNNLRTILQSIHECHDIWVSDVGKLEDMEYLMRRVIKFVPQEDEDGRPIHYQDWVLVEIDEDDL